MQSITMYDHTEKMRNLSYFNLALPGRIKKIHKQPAVTANQSPN
jgi:hypothetical protein